MNFPYACLLSAALVPAIAHAQPAASAASTMLERVHARGKLNCGAVREAQDWNKEDLHGNLTLLENAMCRAVAVAVLGKDAKVALGVYQAEPEALKGLQNGEVDLVVGVTPTVSDAFRYGLSFGPVVFWDRQTFMVHKALNVTRAEDLAHMTVCTIDGTDNDTTFHAAMQARKIAVIPFNFQEEGEMDAGLIGGRCRAISAMESKLAEVRTEFHAMVHDFVILPEQLAVSPVAVATRRDDVTWTAIAGTAVNVLIEAEMLGVRSTNVAEMQASQAPQVMHLVGSDWSAANTLGLAHDFAAVEIATLGNYGEIFDRTVGKNSDLGLERGLNADCLHGGMICAEPVR